MDSLRSPLIPDVRPAGARPTRCAGACGMSPAFVQPVTPRDHARRSSAPLSSSGRPRSASSLCTPPTGACVAPQRLTFSRARRLVIFSRAFGSSVLQLLSCPRPNPVHLRSVSLGGLAMPSFDASRLSPAPRAFRAPANRPGPSAFGFFMHVAWPHSTVGSPVAGLTPACSGLASLATDARR